jgi:uncharacterized membrane protein
LLEQAFIFVLEFLMSVYFLLKSSHLLFVMAWVAAVFYLPRLMINFAESPGQADVQARLLLMARRLYKFGHVMFALALVFGVGLIHFAGFGPWLHVKLLLVAILFAYYILVACDERTAGVPTVFHHLPGNRQAVLGLGNQVWRYSQTVTAGFFRV